MRLYGWEIVSVDYGNIIYRLNVKIEDNEKSRSSRRVEMKGKNGGDNYKNNINRKGRKKRKKIYV